MAAIAKTDSALAPALAILRAGGIVAIPTETVYGLAGDATDGAAVATIFEVKGRPRFNPLIVHVADMEMARALAEFDGVALRLAERFWPGPLTLVLPMKEGSPIHPLVAAGLSTVALRMPGGFAHELIAAFGRPLAAPSANTSGRITATTAEAVAADLGERLDLIVDGGPTPVGLESTIVRVEEGGVRVLRPGGIPAREIEQAAGVKLLRAAAEGVQAPGMLASHYAPGAAVRPNAGEVRKGEALLGFGPKRIAGADKAVAILNLSATGDLREAATNLFSHLAALDRSGASCIAVEPVPREGLGEAINDRLARAAAPRDSGGGEIGGDSESGLGRTRLPGRLLHPPDAHHAGRLPGGEFPGLAIALCPLPCGRREDIRGFGLRSGDVEAVPHLHVCERIFGAAP